MEYCMEAKALKSSLRRELAMKSTQQALFEELWCATGISGVPSEDFSVDDLLDLSNGEFEDAYVAEVEEEEEEEKDSISDTIVSADSETCLTSQLLVPDDNLAELEWVSQFVDDSLSDVSLLHPVGTQKRETPSVNWTEPETKQVQSRPPWFPSQVPVKPRTKRCRPVSRVWSLPSSSSPSSSSSCSSGFSFSTPCLIFNNPVQSMDVFVGEPEAKKQKKKPAVQTGFEGSVGVQFQRRCSHCHVQRTPQWRTGPLGAKTLCNACGVRFKSGRLFPEYRPACSPTFSGDVHSNSHRKVLEMRRRKEVVGGTEPGLNRMIPGFLTLELDNRELELG